MHHTHVQASSVNDCHSESRVSVRTSPSYVSSPNKVAYSWSVSQLMIDVSTTKLVYTPLAHNWQRQLLPCRDEIYSSASHNIRYSDKLRRVNYATTENPRSADLAMRHTRGHLVIYIIVTSICRVYFFQLHFTKYLCIHLL